MKKLKDMWKIRKLIYMLALPDQSSDSDKTNSRYFSDIKANFCEEKLDNYSIEFNSKVNAQQICDEIIDKYEKAIAINLIYENDCITNLVRNDYVLVDANNIMRCVDISDKAPPTEPRNDNPSYLPEAYLNIVNMEVDVPEVEFVNQKSRKFGRRVRI